MLFLHVEFSVAHRLHLTMHFVLFSDELKVCPSHKCRIHLCSHLNHRITATGNRQTILPVEFILYYCFAMLVNSPFNFELKYVVVTCVTEIVTSNNITQFLLVMHYITALQQKVIYYCNIVTFVMRDSQHWCHISKKSELGHI